MIFTLYYMYATFLQWWRLGALKNKLNGTLNSKNALLLGDERVIYETKKKRSFENLLFRNDNRIGATIVPKSKVNLSCQWVVFPREVKLFPIFFGSQKIPLESPHVYLWIQAVLDSYTKHHSEILQLENFGEPVAWKVTENFELILKTDLDKLTKIVHCFSQSNCDINHELQVLKIETVEVEGKPKRIPFERQYSTESTLKYSHRPMHWGNFVYEVKQLYSKVRDTTNPKITIDNGSVKSEDLNKKVPVSEVKPIKKERKHSEKHPSTLDVNSSDYRRHKSNHHGKKETEKSSERHKNEKTKKEGKENSLKEEQNLAKYEIKSRDYVNNKKDNTTRDSDAKHYNTERKEDLEVPQSELENEVDLEIKTNDSAIKTNGVSAHEVVENCSEQGKDKPKLLENENEKRHKKEHKVDKHGKEHKKDHKRDRTESEKYNKGSTSKSGDKETYSRSSSKEKKLVRSWATTDEPDASSRIKKLFRSREKPKDKKSREKSEEKRKDKHKHKTDKREKTDEKKSENLEFKANCSDSNVVDEQQLTPSENNGSSIDQLILKKFKPPNILVYADSLLAKENVKQALKDILNKEKYTVYDLPISNKTPWSDSTVLVIVCGTVDAKLTSSLMKYLLNGGQLLCLCSDLLYSVLHTFTTAEVREHELVTFSYGKWQNVKMMHSLFCYQASPAKKQFSKDSDASNHSSGNGSSPIAPRTPAAVQIQHNGKDYTIQVQVLGTEETWQTPSLLLASVKGSGGRAIFSQVHLEIDPSQYEGDENKFEILKSNDSARLEILRDILANQLELDCSSDSDSDVVYTPAYFLGRHDLKLKMLQECPLIKDGNVALGDINLAFVGKDGLYETASRSFLPTLIHACPTNFSTVSYFETLETKNLGRLVLYSDILQSSFKILSGGTFADGLAVICRQQTAGVGRSNNTWLSPIGSALLSLQLHIPLDSNLGKTLPIIQHIAIVAVVSAVKKLTQYDERIDIGIKWPNDFYAFKSIKIGGLMVTSACYADLAVVNIGCGVNLNNQNPTTCINQMIREANAENGTTIPEISLENYMASVCNEIERLIEIYQSGQIDEIFELYYKYWLHNNSSIIITSKDGNSQKAKVVGIDDYGFLKIQTTTGKISTVTPDGNTFDMMNGLIYPKSF